MMHKPDISLLWGQLPQSWITLFVNAICDGNHIYDDHFGDTAVYLDVEDVVQASGTECNVQSVSAIFGFNNANGFADCKQHSTSSASIYSPSFIAQFSAAERDELSWRCCWKLGVFQQMICFHIQSCLLLQIILWPFYFKLYFLTQ